jgi:hypothetical protein
VSDLPHLMAIPGAGGIARYSCSVLLYVAVDFYCKRQGKSEPHADGKLSHLLTIQMLRIVDPASVNFGESESSHPPS